MLACLGPGPEACGWSVRGNARSEVGIYLGRLQNHTNTVSESTQWLQLVAKSYHNTLNEQRGWGRLERNERRREREREEKARARERRKREREWEKEKDMDMREERDKLKLKESSLLKLIGKDWCLMVPVSPPLFLLPPSFSLSLSRPKQSHLANSILSYLTPFLLLTAGMTTKGHIYTAKTNILSLERLSP